MIWKNHVGKVCIVTSEKTFRYIFRNTSSEFELGSTSSWKTNHAVTLLIAPKELSYWLED